MDFPNTQHLATADNKSPFLLKQQHGHSMETRSEVSICINKDSQQQQGKRKPSFQSTTALKMPEKRSQVKNACVNCQKSRRKCNYGRPCERCVKAGLNKTCQDSTRKTRKKELKRRSYYRYKHHPGEKKTRERKVSAKSDDKVVLFKIYSPEMVKEQIQQQQVSLLFQKNKKKIIHIGTEAICLSHPAGSSHLNSAPQQPEISHSNLLAAVNNSCNSLNAGDSKDLGGDKHVNSSTTITLLPSIVDYYRISDNTIANEPLNLGNQQIPHEHLLEMFSFQAENV